MIPPELALVLGISMACMVFAVYRGATALTWAFVAGYLLLPSGTAINFQDLPPIDKMRAIWLGAALGTVLFQSGALGRLRWHPADGVMLAVIALQGYSSIANGLGYWDAQSACASVVLTSVLPYLLARIHFRSVDDLVDFGKALFWGGVLYVPLAVWEFRMSPQLHATVYGYFPHSWVQHVRWGFYRPVVFLGHGVGVAALFTSCLLIGVILARRRLLRWPWPAPTSIAIPLLVAGLLVAMSIGPWFAVPLVWAAFRLAKRWPWVPVAAGVPGVIWVASVFAGGSGWGWMTRPLEAIGATQRAASMQYRIDAINEYAVNIRQRPWFGHGGWGRGRIDRRATDSEALVLMLKNGLVGASAWYLWQFWIVLAACRVAQRYRNEVGGELIRLFAALMGVKISFYIFGFAAGFVPTMLIGGAVTGLTVACSQRRAASPAALAARGVAVASHRASHVAAETR